MRISIDISQIIYGSGVSVYTKNLIETLLAVDKKNSYSFFFSSLRRRLSEADLKIDKKKAEVKEFRFPPTFLNILWNQLHVLPIEKFTGAVDVFHSSDWLQPPANRAKLVTTIHDLSFLRWPKSVHPQVLAVQKKRLVWVKAEVDQIIAVSQGTKKEIVSLLKIDPNRITVIHEALPRDIIRFAKKQNTKLFSSLAKKFNITRQYFFAYGSRAPRKNIARVISAFEKVRDKTNTQLVLVGDYQQDDLPQGVITTGFAPRREMLTLFSRAQALVYPSLYEGFGLPILEAFALKVPVITSNTSSMAEVGSKAVIQVNPRSNKDIARAMEKITKSRQQRRLLIANGTSRLKEFSWIKAAKKTIKVYEKALRS